MGKAVIVSAPSGAGKTTIVHELLNMNLKLEFSISATSRPKRGEEIHGKDYYFLSEEEFRSKIDDDEYEIEEILTLYKSSEFKNVAISDKDIIKMINHYYSPQVEVIENKYITNIRCNLWIKHEHIRAHLETFKATQKIGTTSVINNSNKELISFDELYKSYKSYCIAKHIVDKQVTPIVSKQFFEKFLLHELQQYIQFDKFVSSQWLNDE